MNPLDQLADIHLPPPIGFWPLAWGWWLLASILLALIIGIVYWWLIKVKKNAYRKQALRELVNLRKDTTTSTGNYIQHANQILHRCALHHSTVNASLAGEAWLHWLDQQCKPSRNQFSAGIGRVLLNGPYQADFTLNEKDQQSLHTLILLWIKQHSFLTARAENLNNV